LILPPAAICRPVFSRGKSISTIAKIINGINITGMHISLSDALTLYAISIRKRQRKVPLEHTFIFTGKLCVRTHLGMSLSEESYHFYNLFIERNK